MSTNLIQDEDYQVVSGAENGIFTVNTFNSHSLSNDGLIEDFQNIDTIPPFPIDSNSCFDLSNLPKIETLDSLLNNLCEIMVRFDGCVRDYQKADFEQLIKTISNSLIYLYTKQSEGSGESTLNTAISFKGVAVKTTNPHLDAIISKSKYPGIYFAQEFGNYSHFGINVSNDELFNSIVLLVPKINSDGLFIEYEKIIYNLKVTTTTYKYSSDIPRQMWVINHNLNKKPTVIITDTAGTLYDGAIFYNDNNNLTITFSAPFNGYADLN